MECVSPIDEPGGPRSVVADEASWGRSDTFFNEAMRSLDSRVNGS